MNFIRPLRLQHLNERETAASSMLTPTPPITHTMSRPFLRGCEALTQTLSRFTIRGRMTKVGKTATGLYMGGSRGRNGLVTTENLDEYVYQGQKAGGSGFLLKDARRGKLTSAIRAAATGETLLAAAITRRLIEDFCS